MTTTAHQDAAVVAAMTPPAMLAVVQHMIDRHLPAPLTISQPSYGDRELPVLIYSGDIDPWVDSVAVDTVIDEPAGVAGRMRRTVHARLDNGIRVALMSLLDMFVRCVGEAATCGSLVGGKDDVEPGCLHGRDLCAVHRTECSECVDDRRQACDE
jgi:hypothetical protein